MYINNKKFIPKRFSSGEMKLLSSIMDKYIVNNKVEILYLNQESIFELFIIIDYYKQKNVTVDLLLSYLPYQRMDHKDRDEVNTTKLVSNIFNLFKLNKLIVFEPHCNICEFENAKSISYVELLIDKIKSLINFNQDDYVCFTDKGSRNRYKNIIGEKIYFEKERDINTGLICKYDIMTDFDASKKVLIVDDIISTGDTLCEAVDKLTQKGVQEIYILCGQIENNKYNNRIIKYPNVKHLYSTNSLKKRRTKKMTLFDVRKVVYGK